MKSILYCEVMDTAKLQQQGLQYVLNLPWNAGALFVYQENTNKSFWMKQTNIPLELIFMDSHYKVLSVHEMKPHDETYITCETSYKYALEVNPGWCEGHGVYPGVNLQDIIDFQFI